MKHLLLMGLLAFTSNVLADIIEIDATNSGFYTSSGFRNGPVSSIFAGDGSNRNWIAFDLSVITDEILSASLTIYNDVANDDGIHFTWSEVATPISEVFTSAGDGVDIFNDLNDGSVFATGTTASGGNDVYSLTDAALLSLNNASSYWLMGGATADDLGRAYGFTNGVSSGDQIRLTLETSFAAVPVPAAFWLFGSGLIGVVAVARRKH